MSTSTNYHRLPGIYRLKDTCWDFLGLFSLGGIFLFFTLSCGSSIPPETESVSIASKVSNESQLPSRRDLRRAFRDKRAIMIVYGSQNPLFAKQNKELATLNGERLQGFTAHIYCDQEVSPDSLGSYPLLLIGSPGSNSVLAEIQAELPYSWKDNCLAFDEKTWCDSSTVFSLSYYPNPLNQNMPLMLVTAQDDQVIYDLFTQIEQWDHIIWDGWDYKIYENQAKRLLGKFNNETGGDWKINRTNQLDLEESTQGKIISDHYQLIDHDAGMTELDLQTLIAQREARYQEIFAFCGVEKEVAQINYHLYPSTERKGLMMHNTDQMHVSFSKQEVYAVHNAEFEQHPVERDNELILRSLLGEPKYAALERGLGIYFTENWQGEGYLNWAKHLYQSDNMAPLAELFDNNLFAKESEYVMGALAGSFVAFLVEKHWGKERFLQQYASWQPNETEIKSLQRAWHAYLRQGPQPTFPKRAIQTKSCFRGFNFTHEGYQIYNGYISQKATESLEHLAGIGTNAVAIVPYTGMRDHTQPSFLPISNSPGSENDESIIHSLHSAKKLGMTTLLKPQVWLWSSWPGDVNMENEADWQQFFDYYYRWIRHYAMMGEMREADIFCMGVEFQHATLSHEQEWRDILKKLRGLFKGPITYAANWGAEFEGIGLWDELDYISINCYYPLSKKDNPTDEDLKEGCEKIIDKINRVYKKYQKPVLFTELGFRSVEAPWQNPHEEAGSRAYNADHQARAYRIFAESMKDQPWCRGMFWWKWPTILTNGGESDRRFIPYKKPAEEVIRAFYADWE